MQCASGTLQPCKLLLILLESSAGQTFSRFRVLCSFLTRGYYLLHWQPFTQLSVAHGDAQTWQTKIVACPKACQKIIERIGLEES